MMFLFDEQIAGALGYLKIKRELDQLSGIVKLENARNADCDPDGGYDK